MRPWRRLQVRVKFRMYGGWTTKVPIVSINSSGRSIGPEVVEVMLGYDL